MARSKSKEPEVQKNAECPSVWVDRFSRKWWYYGASAHRKGWSWKDTGYSIIVNRKCKNAWSAGWNAQNILSKLQTTMNKSE